MGYSIRVDTDELSRSVVAVNKFVSVYGSEMNSISEGISGAVSFWQGEEYNAFCNQWNTLKSSSSVSGKTCRAMENYANYLNYAKQLYETAQQNAKNRARGL